MTEAENPDQNQSSVLGDIASGAAEVPINIAADIVIDSVSETLRSRDAEPPIELAEADFLGDVGSGIAEGITTVVGAVFDGL